MPTLHVQHLGLTAYPAAWAYQEQLMAAAGALKAANRELPAGAQTPIPNYLLTVEHPPVYTLGKSGKPEHLLLDEAGLAAVGATFVPVNRGGDITFHGPGALVVYPIFDLDQFFTDIHRYLRTLEEAVIRVLAQYGLTAGRIAGLTGVWLDFAAGAPNPRKICAMGVKASRWITMHGLSLNVNTDLTYFTRIVPCGIADKAVTSMQAELGRVVPSDEVRDRLVTALAEQFAATIVSEAAVRL
ncbi:MAG: lipoyl(octanoyl) transferase LipB [Hymenobacteraceae bacterium]|nr:lipoyl(octanoyl) transferase LipB [Hymenobacteraceae bacterium]